MITIVVPHGEDKWDEVNQEFILGTEEWTLTMEHSLYAISKWEEKYEKPFLGDGSDKYVKKTPEELMYYYKCMTLTEDVPDEVYDSLTFENVKEIDNYMASTRSASSVTYLKPNPQNKKEIVTSELIYCWMSMQNIPFECDKWFLTRLLNLIELVSIKNDPNPKSMNAKEHAAWRKAQNAKRRAKSKHKH